MSNATEQRSGARVEYHGEGAGLGRIEKGGDTSSRYNYVVFCQCNLQLGPLGGFKQDKLGRSSLCCPRCQQVLIIDDKAQILSIQPLAKVLESLNLK